MLDFKAELISELKTRQPKSARFMWVVMGSPQTYVAFFLLFSLADDSVMVFIFLLRGWLTVAEISYKDRSCLYLPVCFAFWFQERQFAVTVLAPLADGDRRGFGALLQPIPFGESCPLRTPCAKALGVV